MSFAAVGIIVACLLIMGTFALVAVNVEAMLGDLEQENSIIAFVDENLSEEQARAIGDKLESISNVQSSTFISREQALKEFVAKYKDDSLFSEIPASALRTDTRFTSKILRKWPTRCSRSKRQTALSTCGAA
jgi:cell division transport system permease protein